MGFGPMWKKYYYRILGFGLLGLGLFVILEEFISTGQIQLGLIEHETYGLASIIIGFILMGIGGKGKRS